MGEEDDFCSDNWVNQSTIIDYISNAIDKMEISYNYSFGDHAISQTELIALLDERAVLKELIEEQPAVKEAYERLQTLIKLFKA